jgi:hypothetical protein
MRMLASAAIIVMALRPGASVAAPPDYAAAYQYALRCFVVNQQDEASQRVAYDAALKLGRLQGRTDKQISQDFHQSIATESVRIGKSAAYQRQLLAECRKIGMAR